MAYVSLGDLKVRFLPQYRRFTGSNPAESDGFFQDAKVLNTSPPEGT